MKILVLSDSHSGMRFMANKEKSDGLAIGQKAAYFENTDRFVNVVEGGGMRGIYAAGVIDVLLENNINNFLNYHFLFY